MINMTHQEMIAFVGFSIVSASTPGPSNLMVAAAGAVGGFYRGFMTLMGVAVGMALLIFTLGFGLGQALLAIDSSLIVMKTVGAAFLLWLSWRIATADVTQGHERRTAVGPLSAALFQWVNPKSWIVSASAIGTYFNPGSSSVALDAALLAALFFTCCVPSLLAWLLLGSSLQTILKDELAARVFNRVMGSLLATSVVLMFL
jgi:threonine/homoserine/homoserine lactone efflux protein